MGWHDDGEKVLGPKPVIASESIGATRRFDLRHKEPGELLSVELESGSLLVMRGLTQQHWQHRLAKQPKITDERFNLTFRYLLKNQ